MPLPKVSYAIVETWVDSQNTGDKMGEVEVYREMFEQQPVFKILVDVCVSKSGWSEDKLDGYCKGLLQAWHLLNQQSIIEDLSE